METPSMNCRIGTSAVAIAIAAGWALPAHAASENDEVLRQLAALPLKVSIVVLDAAREQPFIEGGQSIASGLALLEPNPRMLVAFNAAPGTVAPEEPGPYGAYAQALAEMQKQLASMPPEQRKMLEDSLVRQGINPGSIGTGGAGARVCMTREMVERNELPSDRGDCSIRQQERSGNTMKVAFVCTSPPSSGQGEVTILNPESYAMKMNVTTTARGQNDSMSMQGKGKWLAADCGTVQPLGAKK